MSLLTILTALGTVAECSQKIFLVNGLLNGGSRRRDILPPNIIYCCDKYVMQRYDYVCVLEQKEK